jgi:hypothetical protein
VNRLLVFWSPGKTYSAKFATSLILNASAENFTKKV